MCRPVLLVALVAIIGQSQAFNFGNVQNVVNTATGNTDQVAQKIQETINSAIKDAVEKTAEGASKATNAVCKPPTMAHAFRNLLMKKIEAVRAASTSQCQTIMEKKFKVAQATCLPALLMAVRGEDEDDGEEEDQARVAAGGVIDGERLDLLMAGVRMFAAACKKPFADLRDELAMAGCTKARDLMDYILFLPHKIAGFYFYKRTALEVGYGKLNEQLELAKSEMAPNSTCRTWMDANNATFLQTCPTLGEGWNQHVEFADKMRSLQDQCFGGGDLPPL